MEEDTMYNDSVQDDGEAEFNCNDKSVDLNSDEDKSLKCPIAKAVRGRSRNKAARRNVGKRGGGAITRRRRSSAPPDKPADISLTEENDKIEENFDTTTPAVERNTRSHTRALATTGEAEENNENGTLVKISPVKEEPDDSPFIVEEMDDEGQLLGFKHAAKDRLTAFNAYQKDVFVKDNIVRDNDSGSEGDTENEDKSTDDKDLGRKRGRGRPPMQWKRGRRKKSPVAQRLPPAAVTGLPEYLQDEFQHAYEISTALRSIPKVGPFLQKPCSNMFGMSTYYAEITSPMWLDEVQRKLLCHGYKCISEFVADVRLMLENCYKFWGPEHKFSKIALQLETKLEQKIGSLPLPLKEKCKDVALDGCENDFLNMDADDFRSFSEESNDALRPKCKNFNSKILRKLENCKAESSFPEIDQDKEEKLLSWERLHIANRNEISSSWELPAIGVFVQFAHANLNLKNIRQYEIERMLLIPRESTTLATLMTSMLSSAATRSKLDATIPIMSYDVWNERLKKKVDDWFTIFQNKNKDETEVFLSCGVEPHFWKSLSGVNPYESTDEFSEMSFRHRCLILKALCDNLCHNSKCIQELFLSQEEITFQEYSSDARLGELENYTYFYLPFWPDVRIYMTKTVTNKQLALSVNVSVLTSKLLSILVSSESQVSNSVCGEEMFEDFSLIVESPEDLIALIEQAKGVNQNMTTKLRKYNTKVKKQFSPYLHNLSQIWDQWNSYSSRAAMEDQISLNHWRVTEDYVTKYFDVEDPAVLGKRQRRNNFLASNVLSSQSDEDIFEEVPELEDDGSDWECPFEKKKASKKTSKQVPQTDRSDGDANDLSEPKVKKKRGPKAGSRVKKLKGEPAEKKPKTTKLKSPPLENSVSTVVIKNVQSLSDVEGKFANDIKSQDDITIKPEIMSVKIEIDESNMEAHFKPAVKQLKEQEIKKEITINMKTEQKEELPVISLSSNDEDDDDVIITTPIKQQIPAAAATTPVLTPVLRPAAPVPVSPSTPRQSNPSVRSPLIPSPRLISPSTPRQNVRMQFSTSPRLVGTRQMSPRTVTPRQMSPVPNRPGFPSPSTPGRFNTSPMQIVPSPHQRGMSPRGFSPGQTRPSQPQVNRNLFNNAGRPPQPNPKSITAKLTFGKRHDGSYGYIARLPDGGVIMMSPQQIDNLKKKHGTIPPTINIPLSR